MGKFGKNDLVDMVSGFTDVPKATVKSVIEATIDAIKKRTAGGDTVQLMGFGTFEQKDVAEKAGRNLQTGAAITIPAHSRLTFRASKANKD